MIRKRRVAATGLILALVAATPAGCQGGSSRPALASNGSPASTLGPSSPVTGSPSPSTNPATPPTAVAPLTGVPSAATGVAVVVPIDVTPGGTPPSGLGAADIVSVEFAEGALIRLVGIYQSQASTRIGPIAAVRPSDMKLVIQLNPDIVQAGTPSGMLDTAKAFDLYTRNAAQGGAGIVTDQGHRYASSTPVRAAAPKSLTTPTAVFQYAPVGGQVARVGVRLAKTVAVSVPGHPSMTWQWDATAKVWKSSVGGVGVTAANLVVLTTPYQTKNNHELHRNITFANPLGQGDAQVIAGNQHAAATWYKKGFVTALNLLGPGQTVPMLVPGRTWIILVPHASEVKVS